MRFKQKREEKVKEKEEKPGKLLQRYRNNEAILTAELRRRTNMSVKEIGLLTGIKPDSVKKKIRDSIFDKKEDTTY